MFDFVRQLRIDLLKEMVFKRDRFICQYCGSNKDLTVDHLWPLSKGGTDAISNLVTACSSCNSAKSGKTLREWVEGKSPKPYPMQVRLSVHHNDETDGATEVITDISIPYSNRLQEFAKGVLTEKCASVRKWSGTDKLFSRSEFDNLTGVLIREGLMDWKNERWHNQGLRLTSQGETVFKELANGENIANAGRR